MRGRRRGPGRRIRQHPVRVDVVRRRAKQQLPARPDAAAKFSAYTSADAAPDARPDAGADITSYLSADTAPDARPDAGADITSNPKSHAASNSYTDGDARADPKSHG